MGVILIRHILTWGWYGGAGSATRNRTTAANWERHRSFTAIYHQERTNHPFHHVHRNVAVHVPLAKGGSARINPLPSSIVNASELPGPNTAVS